MRVRLKQGRLQEILARSSLSQNAWAMRVGVSRGHWSDIVNGKHPHPSAKTRQQMLDTLGVSFDELFEIESPGATDADLQSALGDRYVLDEEIGEGAMGIVYRARDVRFGRPVAIKAVSREAVSDLGAARFLKEIHRSGRLVHPHILPLLDAGEEGERPWYVMPLLADGSLRERIASGPMDMDEALAILRGVAAALDHAHAQGLLHCDVKPENILLVGDHAYVADFGLSRAIHLRAVREWERPPEIDTAAGTPAYVSPEQARGRTELDPRSDVYSLACVLFEMLAGRPPFAGGSTTEVVQRRFDTVPPDLRALAPGVPESVISVLSAAMSVDPDERPDTPGELVHRLELAAEVSRPATASRADLSRTALSALGAWALSRRPRRRGALMASMLDDLRYSFRSLVRRPLFAAVAVITLALGIGANAAIFSVIHAVVLSPLPFPEPESLVRLYSTYEGSLCCPLSAPNFLDLREGTSEFADLAGYGSAAFSVSGGGESVRVSGYRVTDGLFELLGATPQIGRFFSAEDDRGGAAPVAVLSDRFWRDHYEADPAVLGETLVIDTVPHTIIGVARPGLRVTGTPQIFVPFAWSEETLPGRGSNFLVTIGRVAEGSTIATAMAEVEGLYADLVAAYPDQITNKGVGHLPLEQWLVGSGQRTQLMVLWGAVGMVLLVACANVINLMLARAESRQRELAVRSALGAGTGRLVRHFLSESLMVSLAGGALGVAAAYGGVRALLGAFGGAVPRSSEVGLDGTVLAFTLGVSLLTGLLVGLVPALQIGAGGLRSALAEGGRGSAGGQSRLRQGLVVLEVAAALVLVVGAGLMLKSFWRLGQVEMGVDASNLLSAQVSLPTSRYAEQADLRTFFDRLRAEVDRLPAIESVGVVSAAPFSGTYSNYSRIMPRGNPEVVATFVEVRVADAAYFETLGLRFVAGGNFDGTEGPDTGPVVVVNEQLVRELFPDGDAIGQFIASSPEADGWQIVGVVEDIRDHGPDRSVPPTFYFPYRQGIPASLTLLARTRGEPLDVAPAIRQIVATLDPEVPLHGVHRLDELIREGLGNRRFALALLSVFAGLALALGAVGIYGVMAYTVERRTREIGLRQALGASPGRVLELVIRQGTVLALIGIGCGAVAAYLLRQSLSSQLFEVEGFDPATYAAVAVLLTLVAATACFLPARRAASVDPMEALREE